MARLIFSFVVLAAFLSGGCRREPAAENAKPAPGAPASAPSQPAALIKLRFQTDWFPQPEHGGFYQALAKGYYREAGLDVEIISGGPGATVGQKLVAGVADLAMHRSDDIITQAANGLPFVIVGAFMQRDPQAILVHDASPVRSFKDLQGRTVMAIPGSNWINYLQTRHRITFNLIPSNFGIARFLADPEFVQQCFITNEPFFVREAGAAPRTLLIADSGYNPYRVIFTTQRFLRENPEAVRAFVAASLRGWDDFMNGDPSPGRAEIAARNAKMTPAFMDFSMASMRENRLVAGDPAAGEDLGVLSRRRLQQQIDLLVELKLIPAPVPLEKVASFDSLPPALRTRSD